MIVSSRGSRKQQGFSIIEALIALAVLSFGLLAIGSFQAKLVGQSAYSKARAEAMALAQAKLDDLRTYSTQHEMVEKLTNTPRTPTNYTAPFCTETTQEYCYPKDVPTTQTEYSDTPTGVNANYTRKWWVSRDVTSEVADNDSLMANVVVEVSWTDREGRQSISLETQLADRNPRGSADVEETSAPVIDSPTGAAFLGDGTLTTDDLNNLKKDENKLKYDVKDNNDGTIQADHDLDGDLELIVEKFKDDGSGNMVSDGAEVVLTLPKACQTLDGNGNPNCSDFVRVSGTVYIHKSNAGSSYNGSITKVTANNTWIIASDAAYCSRYVPTGVVSGELTTSNDLSSPPTSAAGMYLNNDATVDFTGAGNSNYEYFNYTCYLGGGWYGNIGLVMLDESNSDYACMGDPGSDEGTATDAFSWVQVARRRVYRGMTHKYTTDINGDHVEVLIDPSKADSGTMFYSTGIKDAAIYPSANWAQRNFGHDFVIGNNKTSRTVDECKLLMSLPDATSSHANNTVPSLFYHRTNDFVCLNEDWEDAPSGAFAKFLGYPWHYLSYFDAATYDARVDCPYDPSVPPAKKYTFSGVLNMASTTDSTWGSTDPVSGLFDGNINTNDAFSSCRILSTNVTDLVDGGNNISYECDYYVWEGLNQQNQAIELPWSGFTVVNTPLDVVCKPATTGDFAHEARYEITPGITGNTTTDVNFVCDDLKRYTMAGTISLTNSDVLLDAIDLQVMMYDGTGTNMVADCTNTLVYSADKMGATYSCTNLLEEDYGLGFDGTLKITWTNTSLTCSALGGTCVAATEFVPGEATWTETDFIADPPLSSGNDLNLDGPTRTYKITGTVNNTSNVVPGVKWNDLYFDVLNVALSDPSVGSCAWTNSTNSALDYSCTLKIDKGTTWTGNVEIRPVANDLTYPALKWWCGSATQLGTAAVSVSTSDVAAADVNCTTAAYLTFNGSVDVAFASDSDYITWMTKNGHDPSLYLPDPVPHDVLTDGTITLTDTSGNEAGSCSMATTPQLGDPQTTVHNFGCSVLWPTGKTWTGTVNLSDTGQYWAVLCAPSPATYTVNGTAGVTGPVTLLPQAGMSDVIDLYNPGVCP